MFAGEAGNTSRIEVREKGRAADSGQKQKVESTSRIDAAPESGGYAANRKAKSTSRVEASSRKRRLRCKQKSEKHIPGRGEQISSAADSVCRRSEKHIPNRGNGGERKRLRCKQGKSKKHIPGRGEQQNSRKRKRLQAVVRRGQPARLAPLGPFIEQQVLPPPWSASRGGRPRSGWWPLPPCCTCCR